MMPGAAAGNIRGGGAANLPRARLNTQAPRQFDRAGGVLIDGNALAAGETGKARAALQVGRDVSQAINDVGGAIGDTLKRVVMARETAELAEADAAMQAAFESYRAGLPEDPGSWESGWGSKLEELRDSIMGEDGDLSRALETKLKLNLEAYEKETKTRLQSMAVRQNMRLAKVKLSAAFDQAVEFEDEGKARELAGAMLARGLIAPEQAEVMLQEAGQRIDRAKFGRLVEDDPFAAQEVLKDGAPDWMTPNDLHKMERHIDREQERVIAEEAETIAESIFEHPDMSETQLDAIFSRSRIGNEDKQKLRALWLDQGEPDFEAMQELRGEILSLTATTDGPEVWQMKRRVATEVPSMFQGEFRRLLDLSTRDHGSDNAGRLQDVGVKYAAKVIDRELTDQGGYSATRFGTGSDTPENAATRLRLEIALEEEIAHWTRQNPDASTADVIEFVETLTGPVGRAKSEGIDELRQPGIYGYTLDKTGALVPAAQDGQPLDVDADAEALLGAQPAPEKRRGLWRRFLDPGDTGALVNPLGIDRGELFPADADSE